MLNIATGYSKNTLSCSELNEEHAGEGFRSLRRILTPLWACKAKKCHFSRKFDLWPDLTRSNIDLGPETIRAIARSRRGASTGLFREALRPSGADRQGGGRTNPPPPDRPRYEKCPDRARVKQWITPSILCSINRKTQLYKKFLRRGNKTNENNYKQCRNILVQTIRVAKRLYFKDGLEQHKNDGKATWDLLNQVVNKASKKQNKYPDSFCDSQGNKYMKSDVPDGFNTFFSTVEQVLDAKIPKVEETPLSYLSKLECNPCGTIPKVKSSDVEECIKSLNSVGGGIDKISTHIILVTYKRIIHHLVIFFNLCHNSHTSWQLQNCDNNANT